MMFKRRWMALLLGLALLLSASGAMMEPRTEDTEKDRETIAAEQMGEGSVATEEDGPFGRYEEPITITFVKRTDSNIIERFNKLERLFGEVIEDNRWTRLFRDELNIHVEYLWLADASQFDQKWKMSLASGEIPDVSAVNLTDLNQMAEAGMIQDMGEYWEKYAAPLTKEVATADGEAVFSAVSVDGHMMGVPQVSAALDTYRYLWIRTDWMEKLGLEAPKTIDDLKAMMEAFVTQDPDGNGVDDTYAYLIGKDLWYQLEGLFSGFGAYPDAWLPGEEGKLVYGATLPEMKEPLRFLQDAYKAGWLDKEFVVKDDVKANEMIVAGKTGITSGGHWIVLTELAQSRELAPDADWFVFPWPTLDGSPAISEVELGLANTLAVREDYEHPEAIVKMLNLYYEKLYGKTGNYSYWGNDYTYADQGDAIEGVWSLGPMFSYHPLINVLPYRDAVRVVNGEMAVEDLKGASLDYWNNCQMDWGWSREWMPHDKYNTAGDHIENVLQNKLLFTDHFVGAPTETMVERFSQMNEMMDTTFTKIIIGELEVDAGFDAFVDDWYRMGGEKITEEVNAWYEQNG